MPFGTVMRQESDNQMHRFVLRRGVGPQMALTFETDVAVALDQVERHVTWC